MLSGSIAYSPLVKIHLGPLAVSPHGIFIVVGFLVGSALFMRETRARGVPDDDIVSVLTWAGIASIIGARLFYVVNNFADFSSPLDWFKIWQGGISLLGGITGALLVAAPRARSLGLAFFPTMDLAAPWLVLGIAVGRIGDLVIADHLGAPTTFALGFKCPAVAEVGRTVGSPCQPGQVVHLTAAYDMLGALVVFTILLAWRRRRHLTGELTLALGLLYGANRFLLDFAREDTRRLGLTGSQFAGAALMLVCVALLLRRRPPGELLHRSDRAHRPQSEIVKPGATQQGSDGTDRS